MNNHPSNIEPRTLNAEQSAELVRGVATAINRAQRVPLDAQLTIHDDGTMVMTIRPSQPGNAAP